MATTTYELHALEYNIKFYSSWLSCKKNSRSPFKENKTQALSNFRDNFCAKVSNKDNVKSILEYTSIANRLRVDTNVSLNLVKFYLSDETIINPACPTISKAGYVFTALGVIIPIINIILISTDLLCQSLEDSKQNSETKNYEWHLHLKQYQLLKNIFLALLNATNFIINFFNLFACHFYFSFANIALDFIFFYLDYKKHASLLHAQYETIKLKIPETSSFNDFHDCYQYLIAHINAKNLDEEMRFNMLGLLKNMQEQQINHDKFVFEVFTFALMLGSMIILQLSLHNIILLGLLSAYYYNVLRPYIMDFYIEFKNSEQITIEDSENQTYYLQRATLYQLDEAQRPWHIKPGLALCFVTKVALPILVISQLHLFSPVILIASLGIAHLGLHLLEKWIKAHNNETLSPLPLEDKTIAKSLIKA